MNRLAKWWRSFIDQFRDSRVFELVSIDVSRPIGGCVIVYKIDGVQRETTGSGYGFTGVSTDGNRHWRVLINWWDRALDDYRRGTEEYQRETDRLYPKETKS